MFGKKLIPSFGIIQIDFEVELKLDTGIVHNETTWLMNDHLNLIFGKSIFWHESTNEYYRCCIVLMVWN